MSGRGEFVLQNIETLGDEKIALVAFEAVRVFHFRSALRRLFDAEN